MVLPVYTVYLVLGAAVHGRCPGGGRGALVLTGRRRVTRGMTRGMTSLTRQLSGARRGRPLSWTRRGRGLARGRILPRA